MFNLFGLIPWDPPQILMVGIWPLIMGVTMYLQQKLNPPPPDPMQQKIFLALPFVFTFLLAFPAGLVIYWAWNNALSILQQYVIMRRMGVAIGGGKVKELGPMAGTPPDPSLAGDEAFTQAELESGRLLFAQNAGLLLVLLGLTICRPVACPKWRSPGVPMSVNRALSTP